MDTTKTTPAGELRAEALTRTLATIRGRFPRMADEEADELAALLLRSADGREITWFRRAWPGGTHTAEFSLLRHDAAGDAFYVSRIE